MSDESGDQTEAELERTRRVVAATVADQAKGNQAAAEAGVTPLEVVPVEKPKGNAGRDEWAAYATAQGHDIDDEWGRDDIRSLFAEEN
jgi:hypothetical protein